MDSAPGYAATRAGKDALASESDPGVVTVVVAGMNEDVLAAGTVAALYFQPLTKAGSANSLANSVSLNGVVVSDPSGGEDDAVVANNAAPQDTRTASAASTTTETPTDSTSSAASPGAANKGGETQTTSTTGATSTSVTPIYPAGSVGEVISVAAGKSPVTSGEYTETGGVVSRDARVPEDESSQGTLDSADGSAPLRPDVPKPSPSDKPAWTLPSRAGKSEAALAGHQKLSSGETRETMPMVRPRFKMTASKWSPLQGECSARSSFLSSSDVEHGKVIAWGVAPGARVSECLTFVGAAMVLLCAAGAWVFRKD